MNGIISMCGHLYKSFSSFLVWGILAAHQPGKGFKPIFEVHYSTVTQIESIQTLANLSRSLYPRNFTTVSTTARLKESHKKKAQELDFRLCRAHLPCWIFKFMTAQLEKTLNKYCLFWRVSRRKALLSRKNMAACLCFQSCLWTNHKISWTISSGWIRPKWRCLSMMHSTIIAENQTQHKDLIPTVRHSSRGVMIWLVLQPQDLVTCLSLGRPWTCQYSRVKCETISLTAWLKLGHTAANLQSLKWLFQPFQNG